MTKNVDVFGVPLDLGANIRGANIGPSAIRIAGLKKKLLAMDFQVSDRGDLAVPVRESISDAARKAKYLPVIRDVCVELASQVKASLEQKHFPLVIGGDHSVAMGTVAGVSEYVASQNEDLAVVWIDAHADINTHTTSPSGNIHGMPLSALLGDGHPELISIGHAPVKVKPENVALIGIRNIDGKEKELVKQSGVHYYTMRNIDEMGMYKVMKEALQKITANAQKIHLSFDLDGVDPLYAPGVSTPVTGGLSYREAHLALEMIADSNILCSAEFVELNPVKDSEHKTAELTVELIQSALGKSIV